MPLFDKVRRLALGLSLIAALTGCLASATAQDSGPPPAGIGCTKVKDIYSCNWQEFQRWLPHTRTVTVETQPIDRFTASQLRRLAAFMGKSVATSTSPSDLTFLLTPIEPTGIDFGPGDRNLATLQIYAGNGVSGNRTLLWVETYRGQADRPWPTIVHALVDQFQDRLSGK